MPLKPPFYFYTYTLKSKDKAIYTKIEDLISKIEKHPNYNKEIKLEIEKNLQKLKENNHINIDILN